MNNWLLHLKNLIWWPISEKDLVILLLLLIIALVESTYSFQDQLGGPEKPYLVILAIYSIFLSVGIYKFILSSKPMSRLEKKFFALTYYLAFSGFNIIAVTSQDISQLVQPLLVTVIIKLTFFYNLTRSLITFTATALLQRIEQEGVLGKSILTGLVTDHQLSGKESFLIAVLTVIIYFAFRINSYGIPAAAVLTYTYTIIACGLIGNVHSILMRKSL